MLVYFPPTTTSLIWNNIVDKFNNLLIENYLLQGKKTSWGKISLKCER
jgi:hypothetical protein